MASPPPSPISPSMMYSNHGVHDSLSLLWLLSSTAPSGATYSLSDPFSTPLCSGSVFRGGEGAEAHETLIQELSKYRAAAYLVVSGPGALIYVVSSDSPLSAAQPTAILQLPSASFKLLLSTTQRTRGCRISLRGSSQQSPPPAISSSLGSPRVYNTAPYAVCSFDAGASLLLIPADHSSASYDPAPPSPLLSADLLGLFPPPAAEVQAAPEPPAQKRRASMSQAIRSLFRRDSATPPPPSSSVSSASDSPSSPSVPAPGKTPPPAPAPAPARGGGPPPPAFPTLGISIPGQAGGPSTPFPPNSRFPVPLDTPLFRGHALFILKPATPAADPVYSPAIFAGKQRRFEVQIQGRFVEKPRGTV